MRRVADAETALREIAGDDIDLVFSDIVMPGKMDGLSLARRLREMRPELPILLATGYSDAAAGVLGDFPILRNPTRSISSARRSPSCRGDLATRWYRYRESPAGRVHAANAASNACRPHSPFSTARIARR
jgi:response regulator receiver domain-containing protein